MVIDAGSSLDAGSDATSGDASLSTLTLLELGHGVDIQHVRLSGERMLSQDVGGHWVLWDVSTHRMVASGQSALLPDREEVYAPELRGQTLAVQVEAGLQLRDASDGRVLGTVRAPAANLAIDGSYVWSVRAKQLEVFSRDGHLSNSFFGDFARAFVFAARGELRVVESDQAFVQLVRLADGFTRRLPFSGKFLTWFADGEHFLVDDSMLAPDGKSYLSVYDLEGVLVSKLEKPETMSSVGGYGRYVWINRWTTDGFPRLETVLQQLDGSDLKTEDGPCLEIQGGILAGPSLFHDLRGATRSIGFYRATYNLESTASVAGDPGSARRVEPVSSLSYVSSPGAGDDTPFGAGPVLSIAATPTGRVAIATADTQVRIFDLHAEGSALVNTMPLSGSNLALSDDGQILLDRSGERLRAFHLPDGALIHDFGPSLGEPARISSRDASRLLLYSCTGNGKTMPKICQVTMTTADGARQSAPPTPDGFDFAYGPLWLSPDGRRVASPSKEPDAPLNSYRLAIYEAGVKTAVARGIILGWLDDEHLLAADMLGGAPSINATYGGDVVIDVRGNLIKAAGAARKRELDSSAITPIDADFFFELSVPKDVPLRPWPHSGPSYEASVWTRATLERAWQARELVTGPAAHAGSRIVYASSARVIAEPWR